MKASKFMPTRLLLILLLLALPAAGHASGKTEEDHVRDFYKLYLESLLSDKDMLMDGDAIYGYVSKCTVDRLRVERERSQLDSDPFIHAQDYGDDLLAGLAVQDKITVTDTLSVVPVTLVKGWPILFVFVQRDGKALFITKVERAGVLR